MPLPVASRRESGAEHEAAGPRGHEPRDAAVNGAGRQGEAHRGRQDRSSSRRCKQVTKGLLLLKRRAMTRLRLSCRLAACSSSRDMDLLALTTIQFINPKGRNEQEMRKKLKRPFLIHPLFINSCLFKCRGKILGCHMEMLYELFEY